MAGHVNPPLDSKAIMLGAVAIPFPKYNRNPPTEREEKLKTVLRNIDAAREIVRANIHRRFNAALPVSGANTKSTSPLSGEDNRQFSKDDNAKLIAALRTPRDPKISRYTVLLIKANFGAAVGADNEAILKSMLEDYEKHADSLKTLYSNALARTRTSQTTAGPRESSIPTATRQASSNTDRHLSREGRAAASIRSSGMVNSATESPRNDLSSDPARRVSIGSATIGGPPPPSRTNSATTPTSAKPSDPVLNPPTAPTGAPQPRRTSSSSSQPFEVSSSATLLISSLAESLWHLAQTDIVRELGEAALKHPPLLAALRRLADYDMSWPAAAQTIRSNRQRGKTNEGSRIDLVRFRDWTVSELEQIIGPLPSELALQPDIAATATAQVSQDRSDAKQNSIPNPRKRRLSSQPERDEQVRATREPISILADSGPMMQQTLAIGRTLLAVQIPMQVPPTAALIGQAPMVASPASMLATPVEGPGKGAGVSAGGSLIDRDRDPRRRR